MEAEKPAPQNLLRDLLVFTETEQTLTIVGTDTNAHHTIRYSHLMDREFGKTSHSPGRIMW